MHASRLVASARSTFVTAALVFAPGALAGSPPDAPGAKASPQMPKCAHSPSDGGAPAFILSAENLYEGQQFDTAMAVVRLGLSSCGAAPAELVRLRLLEGMLKMEAFDERGARAAFAAALALDDAPPLPALMSPRASRVLEAVKVERARAYMEERIALSAVRTREGMSEKPTVLVDLKNTGDRTVSLLRLRIRGVKSGAVQFERAGYAVNPADSNPSVRPPLSPGYSRVFQLEIDGKPSEWDGIDVSAVEIQFDTPK